MLKTFKDFSKPPCDSYLREQGEFLTFGAARATDETCAGV